jgi:hypothetical protein
VRIAPIDDFHGTLGPDLYIWTEDIASEEAQTRLKAQAALM